jgi:hypothetical protein
MAAAPLQHHWFLFPSARGIIGVQYFVFSPRDIDMATATVSTPIEQHNEEYVLLHGVRFSTYEALLEDRMGCRKRLTYDDGSLEIMTVSPRHEWSKSLIGRMIEAMTEELNIPIRSGGSTTIKST